MLETIKMSKPNSCSVCCIAMLTGKSFDEAMHLCFEKEPEDFSMNLDAMEKALQKANLTAKRLERFPGGINKNALIECRHKTKNYWHYIVFDAERQIFLDPIPDPPSVDEYDFYRSIVLL